MTILVASSFRFSVRLYASNNAVSNEGISIIKIYRECHLLKYEKLLLTLFEGNSFYQQWKMDSRTGSQSQEREGVHEW
jgi:hypothetical protein